MILKEKERAAAYAAAQKQELQSLFIVGLIVLSAFLGAVLLEVSK